MTVYPQSLTPQDTLSEKKTQFRFLWKPQSDFVSAAEISECITLHPALLLWEEWPGNSADQSERAHQYGSELKTDSANASRGCSTIHGRVAAADQPMPFLVYRIPHRVPPSQRMLHRRFAPPLMDESGGVLRGTGWRLPLLQAVFVKEEIWLCED